MQRRSPASLPRLALAALLSIAAGSASAQDMLTLYGNPDDPDADLVQISPATARWNDQITVTVRVSRSTERQAYGGGTYRSHFSLAVIDCQAHTGWYLQMRFYGKPHWQGSAAMVRNFQPGEAPVAFKDIPGEADRLVRAACLLKR